LFFLCCALYSAQAGNALGPCEGGRGVPVIPTTSNGACGFPDLPGVATCNVNQAFFDGGSKCGECYEVTGPLGVTTVMITDMCSSAAPKCGGDKDNFGIADSAYYQIANSTTDIIYDLGYRLVTCAVTGNVLLSVGSDANSYYFSLVVYNSRVAVAAVGLKCSGWSAFQPLTRGTDSGMWSWNKASNSFQLPVTISIVGTTGQVLQFETNTLTSDSTLDFGSQFTDVAPGIGTCPLAEPPVYIYQDSLTYGWSTTFSFDDASINLNYTSDAVSASAIFVDLYGYGGLQFTRDGGFDPEYFTTLQFDARSNGQATLRIYLGQLASGAVGGVTLQNSISTQWQTFNISLANLVPSLVEYDIVFQNFQGNEAQYWFDNIMFGLAPVSPLANITYSTPTTPNGNTTSSGVSTNGTDTGSVGGSGIVSTTQFNFDTTTSTPSGKDPTSTSSSVANTHNSCVLLFIYIALVGVLFL